MNQESSSEAIAAYEAVALFGKTMYSIFQDRGDVDMAAAADSIYRAGLVLTATEIRSSQRYYQVTHSNKDKKIYPDVYEPNVVGILWSTMAHYGTWL
jgi:endoglucanase Acf2